MVVGTRFGLAGIAADLLGFGSSVQGERMRIT